MDRFEQAKRTQDPVIPKRAREGSCLELEARSLRYPLRGFPSYAQDDGHREPSIDCADLCICGVLRVDARRISGGLKVADAGGRYRAVCETKTPKGTGRPCPAR